MIKKIFFIILFLFLAYAQIYANALNEKAKNLEENKRIQQQLNKKLEDLASDILNGEKTLKDLSFQIQTLNSQTAKLEESAKAQYKELNLLTTQNGDLLKSRASMEGKLIALMAKDFAYDLPIPQGYVEGKESFIAFEILGKLDKVLSNEIFKLSKDYEDVSKLIDDKQAQIQKINDNLKVYNAQIVKLQDLRKKQVDEINRQKTDRAIYVKKLEDLQAQQDELRKTLDQLRIIQRKQAEKEQEKSSIDNSKIANNDQKIRQLGSSYQGGAIKRYTGKKTIAPLDSFTV